MKTTTTSLKPFDLEELLARIALRLQEPPRLEPTQEKSLKVGNLSLDLPRRTVQIGDRTIGLSNQEFILLDTFMRHPNQILSQEYLLIPNQKMFVTDKICRGIWHTPSVRASVAFFFQIGISYVWGDNYDSNSNIVDIYMAGF